MTRNMGTPDRAIRLIVGVLVLGLFGALTGPWKYLTLLGLIPVGTGLTGKSCSTATLFSGSRSSSRMRAMLLRIVNSISPSSAVLNRCSFSFPVARLTSRPRTRSAGSFHVA